MRNEIHDPKILRENLSESWRKGERGVFKIATELRPFSNHQTSSTLHAQKGVFFCFPLSILRSYLIHHITQQLVSSRGNSPSSTYLLLIHFVYVTYIPLYHSYYTSLTHTNFGLVLQGKEEEEKLILHWHPWTMLALSQGS